MLSKTELARLAGVSPLTIDRIEKGKCCRLETQRKILLALGLKITQKIGCFNSNMPFSLSNLNPFRRSEGFVALDIGSSSIKMVEAISERNGYRLISLGMLPLPSTVIQNNLVMEKDVVAGTIENLIQSNGVKSKNVICSVPGRGVIIKKIQMPAQNEQELEANVEFEATNVIPEVLENVNLDYQILNLLGDGSQMEILLVAVNKYIVQRYTEAIQEAGTPFMKDIPMLG